MVKIKQDIGNLNKQRNKNSKKIILSLIIMLLIYLLVDLIVCTVMFIVELPHGSTYYLNLVSMIVSSFFSGVVVGKIHKKNGLINALLFNLPFIFIILIISLTFNNFQFDYKVIISAIVMLLSSAGGGVFAVNPSRKKR